jgi:hypothetical protein
MQDSMKELELLPTFGDFLKSILMLCILEQDTVPRRHGRQKIVPQKNAK